MQKFNGLAELYFAGRPAYAKEFIESMYLIYGFSDQSVIADIGSGTGKLAKQLLDKGSFVYCVEPNGDMRSIAKKELAEYEKCCVINGTASQTGLEKASVDFVTVAQAFHWFDPFLFKKECERILKKNGLVFLIWNIRDMADEINRESFEIYSEYCPEFKGFGGGIQKGDMKIKQFFCGKYEYLEFENPLFYNKQQFIDRSVSGSYSLKSGDEDFNDFVEKLSEVFDKYANNGMLTMLNKTVVYLGVLD